MTKKPTTMRTGGATISGLMDVVKLGPLGTKMGTGILDLAEKLI